MRRTRSGIPIPHARPPLERMLRIHARLRDGGKVNCSTRVENVRVFNARFARPADFSIEKYLHDSFGIFKSFERPREIRVRFDAFAAQLVREREWHSSQKVKELPEGRLELALKLENLQEIERWILGWGEHAEVLAPRDLREAVRQTLRNASAFYRSPKHSRTV